MDGASLTERLLRHERTMTVALIALLFVFAGVYTIFGAGMRMSALEMTAMDRMSGMEDAVMPGAWSARYALLVFLMWWMMMVAMMLPSVAPTVLLRAALLRHADKAAQVPVLSSLFLAGYLLAWAGFSALATAAHWALEAGGALSPSRMALIDSWPGGLVLILAGAYQFTPLKAACLDHCRAPAHFLTERRRPGRRGALAMGVEHGVFCLGCCWVLMVLLFVGGIMNLYWIVALAALVALEKLTPWGAALGRAAGAGLALWGIFVVLAAL